MCFYIDEGADVWRECWPRACKTHRCSECRAPTAPGQRYQQCKSLYDGAWTTFKFCEDCLYLRALLVAHEVGEGCEIGESYYPLGNGGMRRYIEQDVGWHGLAFQAKA
jgi:hypothetical protein